MFTVGVLFFPSPRSLVNSRRERKPHMGPSVLAVSLLASAALPCGAGLITPHRAPGPQPVRGVPSQPAGCRRCPVWACPSGEWAQSAGWGAALAPRSLLLGTQPGQCPARPGAHPVSLQVSCLQWACTGVREPTPPLDSGFSIACLTCTL